MHEKDRMNNLTFGNVNLVFQPNHNKPFKGEKKDKPQAKHRYCNILPSTALYLSYNTTLRSYYHSFNRPCMTALFRRLQYL